MPENIFIYGSLLPEQVNHEVLQNADLKFIAAAKTVEAVYAMYDDGDSPFLVIDKEKGGQVIGELYEVDEAGLHILDAFESDECERFPIAVHDEVGNAYDASIYLPFSMQYQHLPRLPIADWVRRKK